MRTGLRVLPEGDHMKVMFAPKGSRASGGNPRRAGALGTIGNGGTCIGSFIVVVRADETLDRSCSFDADRIAGDIHDKR